MNERLEQQLAFALEIDKVKNIDRWPGEGNLCNILNQVQSTGGGPANVLFDLAVMDKNLPLYAAGVIPLILHLCKYLGRKVLAQV